MRSVQNSQVRLIAVAATVALGALIPATVASGATAPNTAYSISPIAGTIYYLGNGVYQAGPMSCPSRGSCEAAFTFPFDPVRPLLAAETAGVWQLPIYLAMPSDSWNGNGQGVVTALTCTSPGNCIAVGTYESNVSRMKAFVAIESSGAWAPAVTLAITDFDFQPASISCPSVNLCVMVGTRTQIVTQALSPVVGTLSAGTWSFVSPSAIGVNAHRLSLTSVTCISIGNCMIVGNYQSTVSSATGYKFASIAEAHGRLGAIKFIPTIAGWSGYAAGSQVLSIACPLSTWCEAVGSVYEAGQSIRQAFTVHMSLSGWLRPKIVTRPVGAKGDDQLSSISCPTVGNCLAGGYFNTLINGIWAPMADVMRSNSFAPAVRATPPSDALPQTTSYISGVSCVSTTICSLIGEYTEWKTTVPFGGKWKLAI